MTQNACTCTRNRRAATARRKRKTSFVVFDGLSRNCR
jgi:hypothetical protein